METVRKYLWLFLTSYWIYGLVEGQSIDNNLQGIGAFGDPCNGLNCQNFGRCMARNGRPMCVCPHHTRGSRCEEKVPDLCTKCWTPGTKSCNRQDGFCECKAYYYGRTCQSVDAYHSRGFFKKALEDEILRNKKAASSFLAHVRLRTEKIPGEEALNVPAELNGDSKKTKDENEQNEKERAVRKAIRKMMKERLKKALLPKE